MNNYGNYVVQKALKLSSKKDKIDLIKNITKNIDKIKDKKLNQKWKTIIESNLEGTFDFCEVEERSNVRSKTMKTGGENLRENLKFAKQKNVFEFGGRNNAKHTTQKYFNKADFERNVYYNSQK